LFGGGELFRSLLELKLVDEIEVAVIPVLLGAGLPMLPSRGAGATAKLALTKHKVFKKTGTLLLNYQVKYARGKATG
jgi:dihydrofolate reductase